MKYKIKYYCPSCSTITSKIVDAEYIEKLGNQSKQGTTSDDSYCDGCCKVQTLYVESVRRVKDRVISSKEGFGGVVSGEISPALNEPAEAFAKTEDVKKLGNVTSEFCEEPIEGKIESTSCEPEKVINTIRKTADLMAETFSSSKKDLDSFVQTIQGKPKCNIYNWSFGRDPVNNGRFLIGRIGEEMYRTTTNLISINFETKIAETQNTFYELCGDWDGKECRTS